MPLDRRSLIAALASCAAPTLLAQNAVPGVTEREILVGRITPIGPVPPGPAG